MDKLGVHAVREGLLVLALVTVLLVAGIVVFWLKTRHEVKLHDKELEMTKLMTRELNHRIRNLLQTVQALAFQSHLTAMAGREITDQTREILGKAHETFERKIAALGQSHSILTKSGGSAADLRELVEGTLTGLTGGRFIAIGPDIQLKADHVIGLNMVLHELATNAAKYGSISTVLGRVIVSWEVTEENCLIIDWAEEGGPPVKKPERVGFGTQMITGMAMQQIRGTAKVEFEETGVTAHIELPL